MKKRVLLHADSLIRDPAYMLVLASLLRRRGVEALVSSRVTTGFYLRLWKPHVLVHSQAHTVRGYFDQGLIDEKNGPLVVFVPQEGNNSDPHTLATGFRGVLDEKASRFIHRVHHFNEWHVDWFRENSAFRDEQLTWCGNPRLDLVKFSGIPDERPGTGRIGFVGRFPSINKYEGLSINYFLMGDFRDQSLSRQHQRLDQLRRQVNVLYWYGQFIHALLNETDYSVSVRPHHEESRESDGYRRLLDGPRGERVELDSQLSVYHWATGLDAAVSTTSLTSMECYLARTPFLCIDRMAGAEPAVRADGDEALLFESLDERFMPRDPDHFMGLVQQIRNGTMKVERVDALDDYLRHHFGWPYRGSVLASIADSVLEALDIAPRQPPMPYLPAAAGVAFFVFRALQQSGRQPRFVIDKNYCPMFHGKPDFIETTADNIEASRDSIASAGNDQPTGEGRILPSKGSVDGIRENTATSR